MAISSMKGAGVRAENRKFFYRCSGDGHVTAMAVPTDDFIRRTVAELIRDPRVVATMTEVRDDGLGADRERRAVLAANLIRFEADYAEGTITGQQLQKATQRVEVELAEVDERLAKGMQRSVSSPIALSADPVQAFLGASIDVQRAVMLSLMQVEILPQPKEKRGAAWTPERLRITPVVALDDLDLSISA